MAESPLNRLKNRVLYNKGKFTGTSLTELFYMLREFGSLGDFLGRDYEIRDPQGKLVYTVRQKPWAISQVKAIFKEFRTLKELDNKIESEKFGGKKKR